MAVVIFMPAHPVFILTAMTFISCVFLIFMVIMDPNLMSSCAAPLLMCLSVTTFSVDLAFASGWEDGPVSLGLLILAFSVFMLFSVGLASEKSSDSGVGIRNLAENLAAIVKTLINDLRGIDVSHKYSALPLHESYPYFQTAAQPAAAADSGITIADSGVTTADSDVTNTFPEAFPNYDGRAETLLDVSIDLPDSQPK
ncbi:hypothetical protein DEU56DRAFT_272225 [Suillus clintonianus]|uniref:uncharacterized protein n=1 Tax=Suillus clintonianus TaxID=1904413 RepID=UPI001B885439|nr:uncharacterized protein DEU56DRAFT_272225 [Suillus clintonianus]KAG2141974.1 hypothetical protein DEU56DRAFT_272225 [Suillus clintonianus]